MRPHPSMHTLALGCVRQRWRQPGDIARWFAYHPPLVTVCGLTILVRTPWVVSSYNAPRWA